MWQLEFTLALFFKATQTLWQPAAVTHRGPLGADLPLTADLQLAGTGGFRPLQVATAARVDVEGSIGVNLATQDLPVLHSQATGFTAF